MRIAFLLVLSLGACSQPLDLPGGSDACGAITDPVACTSNPKCDLGGCPHCDGEKVVAQCVDKSSAPHGLLCPSPPVCGTCNAYTDITSCQAAGCVAGPVCCDETFNGCYPQGTTFTPCSTVCEEAHCDSLTDEASCDALLGSGACHATFIDGAFEACKQGPPQCDILGTFACTSGKPEAVCDDGFMAQYDDSGCVIDCVRSTECEPSM